MSQLPLVSTGEFKLNHSEAQPLPAAQILAVLHLVCSSLGPSSLNYLPYVVRLSSLQTVSKCIFILLAEKTIKSPNLGINSDFMSASEIEMWYKDPLSQAPNCGL